MSSKIKGNDVKIIIDQSSGHTVGPFNTRKVIHYLKLDKKYSSDDFKGVQIRHFLCVFSACLLQWQQFLTRTRVEIVSPCLMTYYNLLLN